MQNQTGAPRSSRTLVERLFHGHGELARLCREKDWAATPLGSVETWQPSLRSAVSLVLASPTPMVLLWGQQLAQVYNDGYRQVMGKKHPAGLGQPTHECWPEAWDFTAPVYEGVIERRESFQFENQRLELERDGQPREVFFTLAYSPALDDAAEVGGVLATVNETTAEVARAQTAEALRSSEARYRSLFESIDEGFCVFEVLFDAAGKPNDYRFLEVNPAFERHTGLADATGKRMRELAPDHEQHWFDIYGRVAMTGESTRFVNPASALDNRWFDLYAFRIDEPDLRRVAVIFTDITERLETEEQQRRRAETDAFRLALADALRPLASPAEIQGEAARSLGAYLGASRVLYAEISSDGEFALVRDDYQRGVASVRGQHRINDYGQTFRARLVKGLTFVSSNVATDPLLNAPERAATAAIDVQAEVVVPLSKGGRVVAMFVAHQSTPREWTQDEVALIEEVAERTWAAVERARAESALRGSEARFRALINASADVMYRMSPDWREMRQLDGRGVLADTSAPRADWLADYIHPDDQPQVWDAISEAIRSKSVFQLEHRVRQADGSLGWTQSRAVPMLDENGEITEWIGAASDVTERKEIEQALREADRRKDEFLAMLAHELRNPLAAIHNTVRLLAPVVDAPQPRRWVEILQRQADQLGGMVDELLDVSRVTRGLIALHQTHVDLTQVIQSALDSVKTLVEDRRHQLRLNLPAAPVDMTGDPVRLEQIVVNLLTNAAKYTDTGGRIDVELSSRPGSAELRVRDNGIGMTPEVRERVFDLFGQAERGLVRSEGGLGIGLTIVKRLVELHGGSIEAHSEGLGQGSEFLVRLPLAPVEVQQALAPEELPAPQASARRILVVEDSPEVAETLALLLENEGHLVSVAHDGPAALALAEDLVPDVILLDIGLPGMDGYEAARRLRANPRTSAIVLAALTGYGQAQDRERAETAGFNAHFVKPVKFEALVQFLKLSEPQNVC